MKVAGYLQVPRIIAPTGVGQHMIHMLDGLARMPGVDLSLMAAAKDLGPDGRIREGLDLRNLPMQPLPLSRRMMEGCWEFLGMPVVDRWAKDADWVYSPTEVCIAKSRVKLAVTVHDVVTMEPDVTWWAPRDVAAARRRWSRMFRKLIQRVDLFLTVSEFTRRRMKELLGIDERRVAVVGNGVAEAYFDASAAPIRADVASRPYAVVIGGLGRRKGGDCVLAAARVLVTKAPDMRVVVLGNSEKEFTGNSPKNVMHLGYVATKEAVGLLRGSVALLFPSRYEGFGIPAAEAMAAGTAVVASSTTALPEVVGDAGIIVDPDNAEQIAEAVCGLEKDAAWRGRLVEAGKKRAERFRWRACVQRLEAALRQG